jgi:hypothetical protein
MDPAQQRTTSRCAASGERFDERTCRDNAVVPVICPTGQILAFRRANE